MAHGNQATDQGLLDLDTKIEKPDVVADRSALESDLLGYLLLSQAQPVHHTAIATGFLEGIQVSPLDVLDQGQLQHVLLGNIVSDDGRNSLPTREPGSAPPTFPRNQLISPIDLSKHHRLQDAMIPDRVSEFLEALRIEDIPRLMRVRPDLDQGNLEPRLLAHGLRSALFR